MTINAFKLPEPAAAIMPGQSKPGVSGGGAPHSVPNFSRADWQILADIAEKMGKDLRLKSPASILQEVSQAAPIYARINSDTLGPFGKRWEIG